MIAHAAMQTHAKNTHHNAINRASFLGHLIGPMNNCRACLTYAAEFLSRIWRYLLLVGRVNGLTNMHLGGPSLRMIKYIED
jgi:hypothetical protein